MQRQLFITITRSVKKIIIILVSIKNVLQMVNARMDNGVRMAVFAKMLLENVMLAIRVPMEADVTLNHRLVKDIVNFSTVSTFSTRVENLKSIIYFN